MIGDAASDVRLVGRAAERGRLGALLDGARAGRSGALLVLGDPGMGKTALLEQAAADAPGLRAVRFAGVESESELAYSGLSELVLALRGHVDQLPPVQADALRGVLALGPPVPGDALTVGAATLNLLAAAA